MHHSTKRGLTVRSVSRSFTAREDKSLSLFSDARLVYDAVSHCLEILKPDSIVVCQCSVLQGMDNIVSRITKPLSNAGESFSEVIGDKPTRIISAFHPSIFSKDDYQSQGRQVAQHQKADYKILPSRGAVLQAQLLEFCFVHAVNAVCGYGVGGSGLQKLKDHIDTTIAQGTTQSKLARTKPCVSR